MWRFLFGMAALMCRAVLPCRPTSLAMVRSNNPNRWGRGAAPAKRAEAASAGPVRWKSTLLSFLAVIFLAGCEARLGQEPSEGPGVAKHQLDCGGTTTRCGDTCVDTSSDDLHCGGCDTPCSAGSFCEAGLCRLGCALGSTDCAGVCQVTASDPLNCGGCGLPCNEGQVCDDGICAASCTGTFCAAADGSQNCVHLDRNPAHCGACGTACPPGQECSQGSCVASCPDGRSRCGEQCVDLRTSSSHCGACDAACGEGIACVEGACGADSACPGGVCSCSMEQTDCGGSCVDTDTNTFHCGACDSPCSGGQICQLGNCACPTNESLCGDSCVDTQSNDEHCGDCDNACGENRICIAGECTCSGEQTTCGDSCVDTQSNDEHCGGCDNVCASYESCVEGLCKFDDDSCGSAAVGVDLSKVLIYQAVETELFAESSLVLPEERTVDVVAGKDAMVRFFVETQAGFSPRELSARVFLKNGETIEAFFDKKSVSRGSSQENLESTFNVELPAESITTETELWVELVECGVVPSGTVGTVRLPEGESETAELGAIETGVIRVALLPLEHDGHIPLMGEDSALDFARAVENHYPAVSVETTVLDPLPSGQSGVGINWAGLLQSRIQPLRGELGIDDDQYLYGVIEPAETFNAFCNAGGTGSCTAGIAFVVDQLGFGATDYQVGVGVGFGQRGVATFTHELGHNHGQCHAPCGIVDNPGDPCDIDPNYPHDQATIGSWGFDMQNGLLKSPTEHVDFMSYCSPAWVSDYAYNRYAARIAAMNAPALGAFVASEEQVSDTFWERMSVTDQGAEWLEPMMGPQELFSRPKVGVVYDELGRIVAQVDVYQVYLSEGLGYLLHVPPQQPGWYAVGLKGGVALPY